jgi:hypothetical protein
MYITLFKVVYLLANHEFTFKIKISNYVTKHYNFVAKFRIGILKFKIR